MSESEYDPHLNVELLAKAKDAQYLLRKIDIEHSNIKIETPYKVIEGKDNNKSNFELIGNKIKKPIFESWSYISQYRSFNRLKYLIEEAQEDRILGLDNIFGLRKSVWDEFPTVLSLVFSKNPFVKNVFISNKEKKIVEPFDKESYDSLLDYIHSASKALILSPDIRIRKTENKDLNINLEKYIGFVDENVKVLSDFNKRPIFVPIQIHLNQKNLKKVLEHYKKQNYTNIWINFNASHIGGTYFSRVRTLIRLINDIIGLDNVVLYYSHIKKEINPHPKDDVSAASDILSQFFAAGFIGINRSPQRAFSETPEQREERIRGLITKGDYESEKDYLRSLEFNQRRIFDPDSYYYYKIDKYLLNLPLTQHSLLKREINQLYNSILLFGEIEKTKHFIEEQEQSHNKKSIIPYIKKKKAIQENDDIFDGITIKVKGDKKIGLFESLGEQ